MTKYRIVKDSKALPEGWEVGDVLEGDANWKARKDKYGRTLYRVEDSHFAALLELGVVEEMKEIKGRACCFNCDIRDRAEEYGYPVGGCMKQPVKKEYSGIDSVTLNGVEIQQNGIIRNSKGRLIGRLDGVEYDSEHIQGKTEEVAECDMKRFMETSVKLNPGEKIVTVTRPLFLPIPRGWISASGYKKYGIWWGVYEVIKK